MDQRRLADGNGRALAANNFEGIEELAGALKGRDVD